MSPGTSAALLYAIAPVDRDVAREAAARELSKGSYHADDPDLLDRLATRILNWLDQLGNALGAGPGGGAFGLVALVLVLGGVGALILWRTGPLRRAARRADGIELSGQLDADEHRRRADGYAGQRRYPEAVRERMRAIVRELEARGVLDPRPGRTADEVAHEAGTLVPWIAADLRYAARIFAEVWYGRRAATASTDAAMREADQRIRSARLMVAGPAAGGQPGYVPPR
jgi:Domain of unknown function (DUF4129)